MHGTAQTKPPAAGTTAAGSCPAPLVVRFGAFGDMVLLTPLLRALHDRFGQPCRVLGSGAWLGPLFVGHPDVASTLTLASRKRPYWLDATQRHHVGLLRADPPGPVYVCDDYSVHKIHWLLRRAAIPADHCVFANPDCRLRPGEHWVDRWQRFATMTPPAFARPRSRGVAIGCEAPYLALADGDRADLHIWLQARALRDAPLVLMQPGSRHTSARGRAGWPHDDKAWPLDRWVALVHAVLKRMPDARVVLCGVPREAGMLREIAAAAQSGQVLAAGGELPLRRLLALCEYAAAMISVDTGPAHAAAALGCPLIVLYGAQPSSLWLPRGSTGNAVVALGGPPERRRVDQIRVDEVIAAWEELPLRRKRKGSRDGPQLSVRA